MCCLAGVSGPPPSLVGLSVTRPRPFSMRSVAISTASSDRISLVGSQELLTRVVTQPTYVHPIAARSPRTSRCAPRRVAVVGRRSRRREALSQFLQPSPHRPTTVVTRWMSCVGCPKNSTAGAGSGVPWPQTRPIVLTSSRDPGWNLGELASNSSCWIFHGHHSFYHRVGELFVAGIGSFHPRSSRQLTGQRHA